MRDVNGNWSFVRGGDGGTSIIDPSNKNIYYVSSTGGFWRHEYGISTKIYNLEGLDAPVGVHPTNSNVIFLHDWKEGAPYVRVMKGIKNGSTWTMDTVDREWDHLRNIEISKSNPDIMYYTMWDPWADSRIKKSTDGGSTWNDVSYSGIDTDVRQSAPINDIWVSSTDPNFIIIVFGGFEGGHIYSNTSGGQGTWYKYGSGLGTLEFPDVPIQCINYDEIFDKLFIGTDVGLFYWDGFYWYLETDVPQTIISDIEINETYGQLVVSTYGRGVWRVDLEHYCNDAPWMITSTNYWYNEMAVCPDVIVENGGHLTITDKITMSRYSTITVASGGILTLSQNAELYNANIVVENGGTININSDAKIYLSEEDNVEIYIGAIANIDYGVIQSN